MGFVARLYLEGVLGHVEVLLVGVVSGGGGGPVVDIQVDPSWVGIRGRR